MVYRFFNRTALPNCLNYLQVNTGVLAHKYVSCLSEASVRKLHMYVCIFAMSFFLNSYIDFYELCYCS